MNGCAMQYTAYVPGLVNVWLYVPSVLNRDEVKLLSTAVTVCGSGSRFFHTTVVPAAISIVPGRKLIPFSRALTTARFAAGAAAGGAAVGAGRAGALGATAAGGGAPRVGAAAGGAPGAGFGAV